MSASASPHVKPRNLPPSGGGGSQKRVILEGDTKESCAECYGDIKYRMCELHQLPVALHVVEFYDLWKDV